MRVIVFDNYMNLELRYISPHVFLFWLVVEVLKEQEGIEVLPLMVEELEKRSFSGDVSSDVFVLTYAGARMPWKVCKMYFENTGKVVGVYNEYGIILSTMSSFDGINVPVYLLTNVSPVLLELKEFKGKEKIVRYEFMNLNVLKYRGNLENSVRGSFVKKSLIYWGGSVREGRVKYFKKYLNDERVVFSVSKKQVQRYHKLGINKCCFVDTVDWGYSKKTGVYLTDYEATVYIEDELTHKVWNYPANRFYEALEYGLGVFFAEECENTIAKMKELGYVIDDWWIVGSVDEIFEKLGSSEFKERRKEFLEVNRKVAEEEKEKEMQRFRELLLEMVKGG